MKKKKASIEAFFFHKILLGNFKKIVNLCSGCSVFDLVQGGSNIR